MDNQNQVTHNPDVLCCLANLSNDEVFTPPQLANEVLDLLPEEIWKDKNAKFLDPCCKTGVFLREITIRLIKGLKDIIPDLQERVNHILTHQVYGIAITELTSLTTRRTLYCSKDANGEYSVCTTFGHPGGNIYYRRIEHDWKGGKCSVCGASQKEFDRSIDLETHAYAFIHKPIEELFNMKFDVIIGNPPYQLNDGGYGASAMPLYHKFVEQAKKLNPKYISMIIPSRWFTGGRGLDSFRQEMLSDKRIKNLVDYPNASDCFPGVDIKGGVCYFLWDNNYDGLCTVRTIENNKESILKRTLLDDNLNCFIRYNKAIPIVQKIQQDLNDNFSDLISSQKPFGFRTFFVGNLEPESGDAKVFGNKKISYVAKKQISQNTEWVDTYKLFIPKAIGSGEISKDWVKPLKGYPGDICTETYVVCGPFETEDEMINVYSYIQTKFFHFMLSMKKNTHDASKRVYECIPIQDFSKPWTDAELYEKYGLTQDEIDYIESMIRPMDSKEE